MYKKVKKTIRKTAGFVWLEYCRYSVKSKTINKSGNGKSYWVFKGKSTKSYLCDVAMLYSNIAHKRTVNRFSYLEPIGLDIEQLFVPQRVFL